MNPSMPFNAVELWHIAGWTMIHFLWLGALIAGVAYIGRLLSRRTMPNVRYAIARKELGITVVKTDSGAWGGLTARGCAR
jgi:hypothetical protein